MKSSVLVICLVCTLGAMSGCEPSYSVEARPLAGTVKGTEWNTGTAEGFRFDDGEKFIVLLHADASVIACDGEAASDDTVLLHVPLTTGDFALGGETSQVYFLPGGADLVDGRTTFDGLMTVTSVSSTALRAGVVADFGDDGELNGTFEVTSFCDPETALVEVPL